MKTSITYLRNRLSDSDTMLDDNSNLEIDFSSRNTSQSAINSSSVSAISYRYHMDREPLTRRVELISIHNALGKNRFDSFQ